MAPPAAIGGWTSDGQGKIMNRPSIIGRAEEQAVLRRVLTSGEPEFVAVYGRRRVGKTFLIREFFREAIRFELTGLHEAPLRRQLENFAHALGRAAKSPVPVRPPVSWGEAFELLARHWETAAPAGTPKQVIFLDELPWLDTPRSGFLPALEHFWNSWGARQRNLALVVCGSAAAWMLTNLVHARGGLHHRLTRRIRLLPFALAEAGAFLASRKVRLNRLQLLELYLAIGGIPHYLKEAEPGLSMAQMIDRLCFQPQGLLRDEFHDLYRSLFDYSDQHLAIVRALAGKNRGLTRNEILAATKLPSGGTLTQRLDELEAAGFLLRALPFGRKEKDQWFRLGDEFSLFYLNWMAPLGRRSPGQDHWLRVRNSPRWRAWSGCAFELFCHKHVANLKRALGISGVETTESVWQHRPRLGAKSPERGAQIDLLIDRKDNCINLCEMKFSDTPFVIEKDYALELRRKLATFQSATRTRKTLFLTFVTASGLQENDCSRELVAKSVQLDDWF